MDWQPIESAPIPKENSSFRNKGYMRGQVLVYCPDSDYVSISSTVNFRWYNELNEEIYPTHWKPLPKTPKNRIAINSAI